MAPVRCASTKVRGLEIENAVISDHFRSIEGHTYILDVRETCCCPQLPDSPALTKTGAKRCTAMYSRCKLQAQAGGQEFASSPFKDGGNYGRRTVAVVRGPMPKNKKCRLCTSTPGCGIIMPLKVCRRQNHRHRRKPLQLRSLDYCMFLLFHEHNRFLPNGIYKFYTEVQFNSPAQIITQYSIYN